MIRFLLSLLLQGESPPPPLEKKDPEACPYCGASLKSYVVHRRSRRGHVCDAEKTWSCGTYTRLEMLRESEFRRGDACCAAPHP